MVFQYLESTLHLELHITCCYVGQTLDKLSGCEEQPLLKMVCIKLVNLSIVMAN